MSARDAAGSGPKLEPGVVNTSVGRHRSPFAASEPRKPAAMRVGRRRNNSAGVPVSSHGLVGWISPSRPGCRPGCRTYRSGRGWTPSSPRSSPRDSPAARACGGCACRKTRCVRAAETLVVPLAPLRLAWTLHRRFGSSIAKSGTFLGSIDGSAKPLLPKSVSTKKNGLGCQFTSRTLSMTSPAGRTRRTARCRTLKLYAV